MQIEVGIPLILLGFLTPILLYFLYKRYMKKKALALITGGEIFDKEGTRFVIDNEGKEFQIPKRKSMALINAINRMRAW
jgi:hypothetical protein